jgi:hypothetical protein
VGGQLLGHELERLGLAGAGGAGHEPVPVEHGEGDADLRLGVRRRVHDEGAEVQGRPCEGVPLLDLPDRVGPARLLAVLRHSDRRFLCGGTQAEP